MAERKFPDWATDTYNLSNGDPNKDDPGSVKQALGWIVEKPLVQFANWRENLVGHFIRANNEVRTEADGFEAEAGQTITMDNSSGSVTGLLPSSPIDGQWVVFGGVAPFSGLSGYSVVVDGNGNDIMVSADSSCTLDIDDTMFKFQWDATSSLWKISKYEQNGRV